MELADTQSLSQIVTRAAQFLFDGGVYTTSERARLANWILARQNRQKGFIFYPARSDLKEGIALFSGEKPHTRLLADNAVELETLRLLALIHPQSPPVKQIFQETNERLSGACFANGCTRGECAHASVAVLRYLTACDPAGSSSKLCHAVARLKQHRDGAGRWNKFPFFFTLLWLTELPADIAQDELAYTAQLCEKLYAVKWRTHRPNTLVRKKILQKVLARTICHWPPAGR